ncbi:MAG TPA: phosphoribosylglycinamide formyltransferase [Clostridia bacterium]|nr:phosphoribosylglycinamide formyltransferase [Clostridia bacterium]
MLRPRVVVLVSGGGTNLQALIDARDRGAFTSGELALVVSSRVDAYALERARRAGIEAVTVERAAYPTRETFEEQLLALLTARRINIVALAGFLQILSAPFVARYPDRIVNVHPSLIPAYCGRGYYGLRVHEAVLAAGETVTGATVHLVNEVPDGGRILLQKTVPVLPGDTPETLQRRVMEQAEWVLLPVALQKLCESLSEETNEGDRR